MIGFSVATVIVFSLFWSVIFFGEVISVVVAGWVATRVVSKIVVDSESVACVPCSISVDVVFTGGLGFVCGTSDATAALTDGMFGVTGSVLYFLRLFKLHLFFLNINEMALHYVQC